MHPTNQLRHNTAVADFKRARKKAAMQQMLTRLTRKPNDLLAYEDIRQQLQENQAVELGTQEIPLSAIVGSVGRYKDFTRDFLPKNDSDEERWVGVKTAVMDMVGMPPIDVYKVGDVYFVIDGNHRVSVARELGTKTITARVTEVPSRINISPNDDPDDIICKVRYAEFLEQTNLDSLRPEADLYMTFCGHYRQLIIQIEAYKQCVLAEAGEPIDDETAVCRWYDQQYLPVISMMRENGVMRNFPERTEADLYVLLSEKREEIMTSLGWEVEPDEAVSAIANEKQNQSRFGGRLLKAIVPNELSDGPEPGQWRKFQLSRNLDRLFADYLVALDGTEADWLMLDQVIKVAQRDHDRLLGLHVVSRQHECDSEAVNQIRARFQRACLKAGLQGEFAVEVGDVADVIVKCAIWADLIVLGLEHLPDGRPLSRLGNKTSQIIQRCPRPILMVPNGAECPMDNVLLGYDGSPKADEALFVAAYLKSRWSHSLTVVTVVTENTPPEALAKARSYLEEQNIFDAEYVLKEKPIAEALLTTAVDNDINMLIMGGFGFRPLKHIVLGSTVDQILREFQHPILICR